ncbi:MAG: HEPN domain-containing protein [Flavobacteriaceae bacterium]|nr:HEPN domain-containing protein [Flavobacteriaceae bacterium]
MAKKLLKQYEILLFKSEEDFIASKYLLDGFNNHNLELNLDIIFFHMQQSLEKLIKCLLDFNGIKFPYTHDLEELIALLNDNNIIVHGKINELLPLSIFAVNGRYAIINDDLNDAEKYINILDEFLNFVKTTVDK